MNKTLISLFVACLLMLPQAALAWGGGSSSSGSRVKKAPAKPVYQPMAPLPASQPPEHRHVVSAVSYHVQFRSQEGWFVVEDPRQADTEWMSKVTYAPEVKKISDTQYEVFGNFEGKPEGQEGDELVPLVVHFTLEGKDENWKVKQTKLHSVNGTEI